MIVCNFSFIILLVIYRETFDNTIDDIDKYSNSMALL